MFIDAEGNVCKEDTQNELVFYKLVMHDPKLKPLQAILPKITSIFTMREGIDRVDLQINEADATEIQKIESKMALKEEAIVNNPEQVSSAAAGGSNIEEEKAEFKRKAELGDPRLVMILE